ncbi:MAG TPA: L-histidine N(alpha)-methyltransferase [Candidatus Sulfotelmatobacter sp.]|nr:L-histidine N(alpha)-methyltransferase [Candidatus Sulfotelmatobacter sp.]
MSTQVFGWSKTKAEDHAGIRQFASDVRLGLAKPQKELHSKYLYDELGSSLFEAITHLPEYGLTRADERLLRRHACDIAALLPTRLAVIELGSGVGQKTRHLLQAIGAPGLRYYPIDVSSDALARCERDLSGIAEVHPLVQSYLDGMGRATAERRPGESFLVMFLGSTIGNFERKCALEFLRDLRGAMLPGDMLLIAADLVKDPERMLVAYDDPTGVTGAFNLNLLGRINRELGGDFQLRGFEHEARWDAGHRRIEMHLRSRLDQTAFIAEADLTVSFQAGETIWTESSHKFKLSELDAMAAETGFHAVDQWIDGDWPFAENLWTVR